MRAEELICQPGTIAVFGCLGLHTKLSGEVPPHALEPIGCNQAPPHTTLPARTLPPARPLPPRSIPTVKLIFGALTAHGLLGLLWPGAPTFDRANAADYSK